MSKAVLSIGTTHPWNIAGVGLDACVIREHGLRPLTVVAAVSAQDTTGLHALHAVPTPILDAQLNAIPEVAAVRVGAVANVENARAVVRWLEGRDVPVVVDPVLSVSLGGSLADAAAVVPLLAIGHGQRALVTPNADEAAALTGLEIVNVDNMRSAALELRARGISSVLVKGGHVGTEDEVVDVLAHSLGIEEFRSQRFPYAMRGTGCTLAAALACALAEGFEIVEAVERARDYVRAKISAQTTFENLNVAF